MEQKDKLTKWIASSPATSPDCQAPDQTPPPPHPSLATPQEDSLAPKEESEGMKPGSVSHHLKNKQKTLTQYCCLLPLYMVKGYIFNFPQ